MLVVRAVDQEDRPVEVFGVAQERRLFISSPVFRLGLHRPFGPLGVIEALVAHPRHFDACLELPGARHPQHRVRPAAAPAPDPDIGVPTYGSRFTHRTASTRSLSSPSPISSPRMVSSRILLMAVADRLSTATMMKPFCTRILSHTLFDQEFSTE